MAQVPDQIDTQAPDQSDMQFERTVEKWFIDRGVPYFCTNYRGAHRFDVLAVFLFMMLVVEVAVSSLGLSAVGLMVVLTGVIYTVVLAPLSGPRAWLAPRGTGLRWIVPGLLLVGAVGVALSPAVGLPLSFLIDAAIVCIGLYAAFELADAKAWMGDEERLARQRARAVSITVIAVIGFALEGSVFHIPLNQAVLALVVVGLILHLARSIASCKPEAPEPFVQPPVGFSAMAPVMPLLVILLGTETALLPHIADSVVVQATAPLALTALLALASVAAFVYAHRLEPVVIPSTQRVVELSNQVPVKSIRPVKGIGGVGWVVPFLVTYPLIVLFFFLDLNTFGADLEGVDAALAALAINILFAGIAWLVVAFGIDAFAQLVRKQATTIVKSIVVALANGLPFLIVFIVFFALTAETWEVAAEASMGSYLGLVAVLIGFTLLFVVAAAAMELGRESGFKSWESVRTAALRGNSSDGTSPPSSPFAERLEQMTGIEPDPDEGVALGRRGRLNALSVLTAYQLIVFIPVTIAAALLFWGLGRLAVPPEVAAQWIGGDNVSATEAALITDRPGLTEDPWLRVGLLLGAFSSLYLAVNVQTEEDQRKRFFNATERGVKQLLAVKVVYDRYPAEKDDIEDVPAGAQLQR